MWSPLGWLLGHGLRDLGVGRAAAATAHHTLWWVHGLTAITWVAAIPFTKALHMLAGPVAVAVRDEQAGRTLQGLPAGAQGADVGYALISDLDWRHLVDLDACTKCGKCHVVCPAAASGAPLSPRDLVLDLREFAEGAVGVRSSLHVGPLFDQSASLFEAVRAETIWACTTCMACVEICPVGIEHVPIVVELRRQLVERGELDPQLQSTLETIYTTGNSFGGHASFRSM
jgi:ferredoxin